FVFIAFILQVNTLSMLKHRLKHGALLLKTHKNSPLRAQIHQTIFYFNFIVDLKAEKPFNTPRRPDSSVGRAED
ncbi:hypothetical protein OFD71_33975, partial [Escherichia coli]|nr:hypothetical protein [Escherichia coli]